jgi:hypothetical protein
MDTPETEQISSSSTLLTKPVANWLLFTRTDNPSRWKIFNNHAEADTGFNQTVASRA